ncbi:MAG: glycosyltransferase [Desulfotomaculaceae bacterium]|nr:glycosyltransferase [Desulfotomaculaceae bacterium]
MLAAVMPIKNEEKRLKRTIETLLSIPIELIIAVINGSKDDSYNIVQHSLTEKILPLYFTETLGFDIPRAIGAKAALERGATTVLFIDGDMDGNISEHIRELADMINRGDADMALTDCYPGGNRNGLSQLANHVLKARYQLNQAIGLEQNLGIASPSHGPHAVSRRLLLSIPMREIAIPPVSLALAAKGGLKVHVGTRAPHKELGSPHKNNRHAQLIAETIIGDCMEAINVYHGQARHRACGQVEYDGYHSQRRWDLLDNYLSGK